MTTEIVPFDFGAVPAHIAERELSAATLALAGGGVSSVKSISVEGGVFRMVSGGKEVAKNKSREMNIVLVRTAPANNRVFYDSSVPYQKGAAVPPLCTSADGIKPDAKANEPQGVTCAACPQNIAGSGNGTSRACRFQRKIAIVLDGDLGGDVYRMTLSATSIFGKGNGTTDLPLEAYARLLASNKKSIDCMVTKMEFDTEAATPKLVFSPVRYLTAEEIRVVEAQGDSDDAKAAIGEVSYSSKPKAIAAPAASPKPTLVAPPAHKPKAKLTPVAKAEPTGFVASDDEVEVEEPVKAATAAPETRESKVSKALAAWGD